ncbi:MAG TPA: LytTR family DNA-binding domain-containing protein [Chloroflexota bacterium]|nr:LytTR family DNA-binding domain-containing protein [Chloroflexota bacterium]
MPLRALVVDDERPALEELRYCLRAADPTVEVETAATALDALRLLKQHRFDAVFVDIQMPGLSGLELVDLVHEFDQPPAVVFVTAYEEYALRAFELRAVDYLLKPVALDRLRETLERLHAGRGQPAREEPARPAGRLDKLPVETAGRTVLIDLPDIRYAEARDDVVYVHTHDRVYATRFSLHDLERRLPTPPFLRIHRAFLANMRNVVEIRPYFNGTYLLKVNDAAGSSLTVSRGRVKDLRSLLGL